MDADDCFEGEHVDVDFGDNKDENDDDREATSAAAVNLVVVDDGIVKINLDDSEAVVGGVALDESLADVSR